MDKILHIALRLTGSRRISEVISERLCEKRWAAAKAAHIANGGSHIAVTVDGCTQEYLA